MVARISVQMRSAFVLSAANLANSSRYESPPSMIQPEQIRRRTHAVILEFLPHGFR
jgi:hypothetical protein